MDIQYTFRHWKLRLKIHIKCILEWIFQHMQILNLTPCYVGVFMGQVEKIFQPNPSQGSNPIQPNLIHVDQVGPMGWTRFF